MTMYFVIDVLFQFYSDSLSAFRDRSSCNSDQMQALANKVKESYGTNTATWQPSIITDMGVIIGKDTFHISYFELFLF